MALIADKLCAPPAVLRLLSSVDDLYCCGGAHMHIFWLISSLCPRIMWVQCSMHMHYKCSVSNITHAAWTISAFEMKRLRKVLRVSWMAKRTNEWVLETAGVSRSLLASVKEMKLAYYGHILRKKGDCVEKELIQGTTPGSRRRR